MKPLFLTGDIFFPFHFIVWMIQVLPLFQDRLLPFWGHQLGLITKDYHNWPCWILKSPLGRRGWKEHVTLTCVSSHLSPWVICHSALITCGLVSREGLEDIGGESLWKGDPSIYLWSGGGGEIIPAGQRHFSVIALGHTVGCNPFLLTL